MKSAWVVLVVVAAAAGAAFWLVKSGGSHAAETPASTRPSTEEPAPRAPETAEDLIAQIRSPETRGHAQLKLQDMGAAALPAIAKAIPTSDGPTREILVQLLAAGGDKQYLPAIVALFDTKEESAEVTALRALALLNASEEKDRVLAIAKDSARSVKTRVAAAEALVGWKSPDVVPILVSWLPPKGESYHDRQMLDRAGRAQRSKAVLLLGDTGSPDAVDPLRTLLLSDDTTLQEEAAQALGKLGDPGVAAVRAALETNEPTRVINSIRGVSRSRAPAAEELIRPFATDARETVRRAANDALKAIQRRKQG